MIQVSLWLFTAALLLGAWGCDRALPSYPLPEQRPAFRGPDPRPFGPFVEMTDPHVELYIVRGVANGLEYEPERWAFRDPRLRFWLGRTEGQRFKADFYIAPQIFPETGPVTVSVFVNEKYLGKIYCGRPGAYQFNKPVPAAWLRTNSPTLVNLTPDRVWISKEDGTVLSFLLRRAGFTSK